MGEVYEQNMNGTMQRDVYQNHPCMPLLDHDRGTLVKHPPCDDEGSAFVLFVISDAALAFKVEEYFCPIGISRNSRGTVISFPLGFLTWVQMIAGHCNILFVLLVERLLSIIHEYESKTS